MREIGQWAEKNKCAFLLGCLIIVGAVLRIAACFWGFPYPLHPDEPTIVNNAIDLISRHSYEVNVFNRPDHFEIKSCAVIFQIVSWLKYHMSADQAFGGRIIVFHLLARGFTAVWGVLMIPMCFLILERIKKGTGLIGALLVAFWPMFVQHSAYATPDIVLTFQVMLVTYLSMRYMEEPSRKKLTYLCIATAVGITIKYTSAICCIWIAFVVCFNCVKKKRYLNILSDGVYCICIVLAACFLAAPNLFTNMGMTVSTIVGEARTEHLGADGLGFWGNLFYYLRTFMKYSGWESLLLLGAGVICCLRERKRSIFMGVGLLFWICTSLLSLHWERWGMPIYAFFIMGIALGIGFIFDKVRSLHGKALKTAAIILCASVVCNFTISGILMAQSALTVEARVDAVDFCKENGITAENTLYDGYSPFYLDGPATLPVSLDEAGTVVVPEEIDFLIMSSKMYERYYAEPDRYAGQVAAYDAVQDQCILIYEEGGPYYSHSEWAFVNMIYGVEGLLCHSKDTRNGSVIKIFRIAA